MPGFNIRNQSKYPHIRAFVSKYSHNQGSDSWFPVPADFHDPEKSFWARNGWDFVVFNDQESGLRRGWYLDCTNDVLELTFFGFDQDLGIVKT
ncbi:hypothetical protein FA15DRAFT_671230 [Coprinopsis marcescibilis]|uniref:Uncharacterized protein n=1 Tax=Coprinopsis marcescibilis TaxID=230819 RepID=A0A5C3KQ88_COPMA|nr:hypothetical protein FA15DRAFT_671230 [Coprinopsis marcescibilis]